MAAVSYCWHINMIKIGSDFEENECSEQAVDVVVSCFCILFLFYVSKNIFSRCLKKVTRQGVYRFN